MARTQEQTLSQGLFAANLYKRNQGKLVRQLTAVGIAAAFILAAWSLAGQMTEFPEWLASWGMFGWLVSEEGVWAIPRGVIHYTVPVLFSALGCWFAWRVINYPKFADFLISVQGELDKVSWESKEGLKRATIVVIVTMFLLSAALFTYDLFWVWLFRSVYILQGAADAPDA